MKVGSSAAPNPLFSIVIPVRNDLRHLHLTCESLLTQSYDSFEVVIVDGASNDGTLEWLATCAGPIIRWVSEPDSGVYHAMNKGIGLAQGKFLAFLGAGDCLLPGSLQKLADAIAQISEAYPRFIYGDVRMTSGQPFTSGKYDAARICRENICHQGIFYEKEIFDKLGVFELEYPVLADWAFNLKCFGEPGISKVHFPEDVAEFLGGGLCFRTTDLAFFRDREELMKSRIGPSEARQFQLREGRPQPSARKFPLSENRPTEST